MKLSIVIPTRERIQYLQESIRTALAIEDIDIEIIVSDNASSDNTADILSDIDDIRFKYTHTGKRVSMRANFENGLNNCTGDYIMFFGDDDGVLPKQIPILKNILEKEKPDVLKWPIIRYGWPEKGNPKTGGVRFKKGSVYGSAYDINSNKLFNEIANCNFKNEELYPAIYHGVVSRPYLDSLRTSDGKFFNCTIPDIFFGYLALFRKGKLMYCDHPFTLNGYSPASNGGAQKKISLGEPISDIAAKFILENSFDNNKDVADFGTSIPAAFFLSLETARVLGNIQTKDINYLAWFKFIIKNTSKMKQDTYDELLNSLKLYAKKIGKLEELEIVLQRPNPKNRKISKLINKVSENVAKIDSIRFSCEKNSTNTIFTAAQICDELLGVNLNNVYDKTTTRKLAWAELKTRGKSI
jgi:glycosyltransferase involved in cell wall biosynthesis